MKTEIVLADLSHKEKDKHLFISMPLGISYVASYAKKYLRDKIDLKLFRDSDKLIKYLEIKTPKILGFSNCSWNLDLSYQISRKVKEKFPDTIIVFGGTNYPLELFKQEKFLKSHPAIDFYIISEGELAFLQLLNELEKFNFDLDSLKNNLVKIGNCHYIINNQMITGENLPRIENLDEIPSPYLSGLMDEFFSDFAKPLMQTTRGCPFQCSYCLEGNQYFNRISRFSHDRIKKEIEYIAKKAETHTLMFSDSNFGMYEFDIETCKMVDEIKKKFSWPRYLEANLGKNKKTVLEAINILGDSVTVGVPVQSTDEIVLNNINRRNISMELISDFIKSSDSAGANSFSEVIIGLPGDNFEKHAKSMYKMIDLGVNVVRAHQLVMIPCSQISTEASREKYKIVSRFRLQPRRFLNMYIYGEKFPVAEIDEICVSNETMSFNEYLDCRYFDLTVELFYNNGIFKELISFLKQKNILPSKFIELINKKIPFSDIKDLYQDYIKENKESLWEDRDELENLIKKPRIIEEYQEKELRNNEQFKYRAIGLFHKIKELHDIAFSSANELLGANGNYNEDEKIYIQELNIFSLLRKVYLISIDRAEIRDFTFDFVKLLKKDFKINPLDPELRANIKLQFFHTPEQKELILSYIKQFGTSINALGQILSSSYFNRFYREPKQV